MGFLKTVPAYLVLGVLMYLFALGLLMWWEWFLLKHGYGNRKSRLKSSTHSGQDKPPPT